MPNYKHHQRYLIPAPHRAAYATAVLNWLEQALLHYSPSNVRKVICNYVADDDRPSHFEFEAGDCRISFEFAKPSDVLLAHKGSYGKVRKWLYKAASEMMREAAPSAAQLVKQRAKREVLA